MMISYDRRYNIAYIRFRKEKAEVETIRVSDELNVNIAPDGTVYGIELLNANEQLCGEDMEKLLVIDEATGERVEVPLSPPRNPDRHVGWAAVCLHPWLPESRKHLDRAHGH